MKGFKRGSKESKSKKDELKKDKSTKQLGVKVDVERWKRFRILALKKERTATELLKQAMAEYLSNHEENTV